MTSSETTRPVQRRVRMGDFWLDAVTEREVIGAVREAWAAGQGGSIFPVNVDVLRMVDRQPGLAELLAAGSLVVADGMPLLWAARAGGQGLPERVTGASLMFSLSEAAAADGRPVFLLGGAEGVRQAIAAVVAAAPALVFVGLGFPRQEKLIEQLRQAWPCAWYLACGGGIPMAAGVTRRASRLAQRLGLEWAHRLVLEPRRLARRYLRDDLPFAIGLLARTAMRRFPR